jgi:broad specificity phosphatase PhoE
MPVAKPLSSRVGAAPRSLSSVLRTKLVVNQAGSILLENLVLADKRSLCLEMARFGPLRFGLVNLLAVLIGSTGVFAQIVQQPQPPATILLIRHAEKLDDGRVDLSPTGFQRARLLPKVFASGGRPDLPTPQVLFATHVSAHSNRPVQTVTPLAAALHLPIDDSFKNADYAGLAATLLSGKYAGKVVLVVWHRGSIPQLASALGAMPPYSTWPEQQYDRIWRIDYKNGKVTLQDLPYALLPGDSK